MERTRGDVVDQEASSNEKLMSEDAESHGSGAILLIVFSLVQAASRPIIIECCPIF